MRDPSVPDLAKGHGTRRESRQDTRAQARQASLEALHASLLDQLLSGVHDVLGSLGSCDP
jgi:hypothetical protein